jgi:hypothetical protein
MFYLAIVVHFNNNNSSSSSNNNNNLPGEANIPGMCLLL